MTISKLLYIVLVFIPSKVVNSNSNQKFGLVCLYSDPYHRQTIKIWEQVPSFVYDNSSLKMLCIRDMNELLYDMDKNSLNVNRSRMNVGF